MSKAVELKEKAFKSLAERLTLHLDDEVYQLISPQMITVCDRMGRYTKEAMIGSEEFRFSHCYPGKKDNLIFCFKPTRPASYRYAEFQIKDLDVALPKFLKVLTKYMDGDPQSYIDNYLEVFVEKKDKEVSDEKKSLYGEKWGTF